VSKQVDIANVILSDVVRKAFVEELKNKLSQYHTRSFMGVESKCISSPFFVDLRKYIGQYALCIFEDNEWLVYLQATKTLDVIKLEDL
jgi:hypothetical protein